MLVHATVDVLARCLTASAPSRASNFIGKVRQVVTDTAANKAAATGPKTAVDQLDGSDKPALHAFALASAEATAAEADRHTDNRGPRQVEIGLPSIILRIPGDGEPALADRDPAPNVQGGRGGRRWFRSFQVFFVLKYQSVTSIPSALSRCSASSVVLGGGTIAG